MDIANTSGAGAPPRADASPPATRPAPRYIAGFDGLRAIAVLMVLVSHVGYGQIVPGGLGVTIFFAISGFLITTLLIDELGSTGRIDLKLFYARRALRLYPELLALIALCLLSGLFLDLRATTAEMFAGLFYYMNYYYVFGAHYPLENTYQWRQLWSLAVEEHFYFLFPGLMLLFGRSIRARFWMVLALVLLPLVWRFVTYYALHLPWQYNYVATDTRIDSIAWGCLLALLVRRTGDGDGTAAGHWFIRPWMAPLAGALLIATLLVRSEDFRWTWRFTLQGIAIVLLIANLLFDPRWRRVVAALEWRPIRYVGRISYGLYLYHMLVNQWIERAWPDINRPQLLAVSLVLSLLVATLSYRLLETPLKALRRRLGSHVR